MRVDTSKFVHLKVRSHYSILEGSMKVEDIVSAAEKSKMPAIALTDNYNFFGLYTIHSLVLFIFFYLSGSCRESGPAPRRSLQPRGISRAKPVQGVHSLSYNDFCLLFPFGFEEIENFKVARGRCMRVLCVIFFFLIAGTGAAFSVLVLLFVIRT